MAKKIAFQGKTGAYSYFACQAAFPHMQPLPCPTFLDAFLAVEQGQADLAMIPIDNSIAGRVADIHHLLPQYHLHFVAEHFLPIDHALLAIPGAKTSQLRKVYSHVHALPQCRKLIRSLKMEPVVWADTASAAEKVAEMKDPASAAIASAQTAEIYGLKILRKNIADVKNNITRFIALSRTAQTPAYHPSKPFITSLIFSVRNVPAALYKVLGGFATNGINMLKLESYMPGGIFTSTLFYAELEGHAADPALIRALDEMRFFTKDIRVLGTYSGHPWRYGL